MVGVAAMGIATAADNNTVIGDFAGLALTTGDNNILIGKGSEPSSATASNEAVIGTSSTTITTLFGSVGINTNSPLALLNVGSGTGVSAWFPNPLAVEGGLIDSGLPVTRFALQGTIESQLILHNTGGTVDLNMFSITSFADKVYFQLFNDIFSSVQRDIMTFDNSNGFVGFNNDSPLALLNPLSTTEQLRLSYDVTNYTSFTVDSTGGLTIAPTGVFTVDATAGNLVMRGGATNNYFQTAGNNATLISGVAFVDLLLNNVVKFRLTSSGIVINTPLDVTSTADISGTLTLTGDVSDGTSQGTVSYYPTDTIVIYDATQFEALATAGVITISTNTNITLRTGVSTSSRFVINSGVTLGINSFPNADPFFLNYSGTGDFFSGAGTVRIGELLLFSSSTGTMVNIDGGSFVVQHSLVSGFDSLGSVSNGSVVIFRFMSFDSIGGGLTITDIAGTQIFSIDHSGTGLTSPFFIYNQKLANTQMSLDIVNLRLGTGGSGDYMIIASCGQTNSGSNRTTMTVHVNDIDSTVVKDDQNASSVNHRALVANGIITLADGDYLTMHIADPDTPANIIKVFDCHLTINRLS